METPSAIEGNISPEKPIFLKKVNAIFDKLWPYEKKGIGIIIAIVILVAITTSAIFATNYVAQKYLFSENKDSNLTIPSTTPLLTNAPVPSINEKQSLDISPTSFYQVSNKPSSIVITSTISPAKQTPTPTKVLPTPTPKLISVSVNARLYNDINCNGEKEGVETYVTTPTTMSLWKMPDFYVAGQTDNPDENGFYIITAMIPETGDTVFEVSPMPVPPGYTSSLGETYPLITLNKSTTFASVEIGVLPISSYYACFENN